MAKKALTQITFDFDAPAEPAPIQQPVQAPVLAKPVTEEIEVPAEISAKPSYFAEADAELQTISRPAVKLDKTYSSNGKRGRRSLKESAIRVDLIQVPNDEELFKKQYYSIGEVAGMFRENQSLIRYWESEFDILQPRKNKKGDRYFRPVDVKNLVLIYDLLRRRKFTIDGARDFLKKNKKAEEKFVLIQSLQKMKSFFLELKATL